MDETAKNQTYNLEGMRKITVLEVAESIRSLIGSHVRIDFGPERAGDFGGREVSSAKAERELGWKPEVDFREGIRETVDWLCQEWGRTRTRPHLVRAASA
jgi:nucleoside-diphosphate-sugar epimerase